MYLFIYYVIVYYRLPPRAPLKLPPRDAGAEPTLELELLLTVER